MPGQAITSESAVDLEPASPYHSVETARAVQQLLRSVSFPCGFVEAPRPAGHPKRVIEAIGCLALIAALSPLFLALAMLVRVDTGLSPIIWCRRVGAGGQPFKLYKFRTLKRARDAEGRFLPVEQQMSRVARFLRRWHLEKLPHLFNIVQGDMSFIGPRPFVPMEEFPVCYTHLGARPGLASLADSAGGLSVTPAERDALDAFYAKNASVKLDLVILKRSVLAPFNSRQRWEKMIGRAHRQMWGAAPISTVPYPQSGQPVSPSLS